MTLPIDGETMGSARIERTTPGAFSLNEQFDAGVNRGSPVSDDYAQCGPFDFTGVLHSVRVDPRTSTLKDQARTFPPRSIGA
ncbi:hypothetical protein [Tomitella fengzijianii]|uniref:Uncharacterized protein n=1 Tax=Tomitella fengzijianii TaxID=2597660 RepID=A0A516WZG5_9ACTN|nr:hypothetical protein [Tomitella fengzijianii]QDQ96256.1 hypothetical protein FO059_01490 [Tomitella fengzijianii]